MTHKDLVKRARAWLSNSKNCTVVLSELSTSANEIPDGIGFRAVGGESTLIECKASRADFLSDYKKIFRRYLEMGMGDYRFFMVPARLVKPEEVPESWGLLEVYDYQIRVAKEAVRSESNKRAEVTMLVSVLRRLEISTAVFVRQEEQPHD